MVLFCKSSTGKDVAANKSQEWGVRHLGSLLEVEVADDATVCVCVLCAASTEPTPHRADDLNDF